jgi:hypothetical protein
VLYFIYMLNTFSGNRAPSAILLCVPKIGSAILAAAADTKYKFMKRCCVLVLGFASRAVA